MSVRVRTLLLYYVLDEVWGKLWSEMRGKVSTTWRRQKEEQLYNLLLESFGAEEIPLDYFRRLEEDSLCCGGGRVAAVATFSTWVSSFPSEPPSYIPLYLHPHPPH